MKIALLGNPNTGKTSLFNQLTGLNQKVGNFPGVTVDKKTGFLKYNQQKVEIIDLPGTYSLHPKSLDEVVVLETLLNPETQPNAAVVVVDASNLKRNLLLFTQIRDLGIPCVLALNMLDMAKNEGIEIDTKKLERFLGTKVFSINARKGINLGTLKGFLTDKEILEKIPTPENPIIETNFFNLDVVQGVRKLFSLPSNYQAFQYAQHAQHFNFISKEDKKAIQNLIKEHDFQAITTQSRETLARYQIIQDWLHEIITHKENESTNLSQKLDKIFTHKIFGYLIFLSLLLLVFQSVFAWANYPMDAIDAGFGQLQSWTKDMMPKGALADLLADGIIAGLGGIVIFAPQIAILFLFIAILEETGYMARVVYIMDKVMRPFGLNGKSVVPLVSGFACAIPAIMATRTIDNWKERLITIFITPLMSCSARLPVYTILIALVIPNTTILGFINLQGLVLMCMYLLGFLMAMISAFVLNKLLRNKEKSYLILEFPQYQAPRWKNVFLTVLEKVKVFVLEAGKVILAISIILWVLASYGPGDSMQKATEQVQKEYKNLDKTALENKIASTRLEASYIGIFGKSIEPAIEPLGYDWKIGIALITSFAAREVFVGTMSTIYSLGSDNEDEESIKTKLAKEINPKTGEKMYSLALGLSLLVFYAFALQCMSTVAIVYRETKGWKWTLIQFFYMTILAYLASLLVYNLFE